MLQEIYERINEKAKSAKIVLTKSKRITFVKEGEKRPTQELCHMLL